MLLSSTANDQLSQFGVGFESITLTSQSGKTVTLLSPPQDTQQWAEFIGVNGSERPLATVSVPQDIYTAATATIGGSIFTCAALTPSGGLAVSSFAYGQTPTSSVTVSLPTPITITGDSMGLSLDMLVSQSASFSSCYALGIEPFSITPTFNLTPVVLSSQPTNPGNGKTMLDGEITAIGTNGTSLTLALPDGLIVCPCPVQPRTIAVHFNNSTVYQGVDGSSGLAVGTFVDMDGAVQADGSVLATRIAVQDTNTQNTSVLIGPVLQTNSIVPMVVALGREQQGYFLTNGEAGIWMPYSFENATFQISGRFTNLQDLPFVASFNGTNMVDGQNVYITTQATQFIPHYPYMAANTITLMPQTINGTVIASSTSGSFSVYTVTLASYNLFPALAVQPGQSTLLSNPSQVEVYVDSNTQLLNTQALALGSVMRFNGLVFNDNGTLRMACGQVNDGVAFSPQSNAAKHAVMGQTRTILHEALPGAQPAITMVRRPD